MSDELLWRIQRPDGRGPWFNASGYRVMGVAGHDEEGCPLPYDELEMPFDAGFLSDSTTWASAARDLQYLASRFTREDRDALYAAGFRLYRVFAPDVREIAGHVAFDTSTARTYESAFGLLIPARS